MMKVFVIGSGGREHALAQILFRQGHRIYSLSGNAGMEEVSEAVLECKSVHKSAHILELRDFAKEQQIDLTTVGSESFLAQGISEAFAEEKLTLFGPTRRAAILETSKVWAKKFMAKYGIATGDFKVCRNVQEAHDVLSQNFSRWGGVVIKPDGLTGGKGVVCCPTLQEAETAIEKIMEKKRYGSAGEVVVLEELLKGKEISLLAFCDGERMVPMIPSQDHKRLCDGDLGPNTGGMGAYAPVPFVRKKESDEIFEKVVEPTCVGLRQEGISYKGVLYFGLMLTEAGPRLLEYNCRLGDPEAQALLPLLESDLAGIMCACSAGSLREDALKWRNQASCCVVMASGGYPEDYEVGVEIQGVQEANRHQNLFVFHAGTKKDKGKVVTAGGRVLGVTGLGNTLDEAIKQAYDGVENIHFDGAYYRSDIGHQVLARSALECCGLTQL